MIYLSRLFLNPRSRRVQSEAARPYELHRSIMRAFPNDLAPGDERVLFRLEEDAAGRLALLVQSRGMPDWSWLEETEGYLLPEGGPNPAVKPVNLNLREDQLLTFRLLANPTVKSKLLDPDSPDGARPVRHGLYRDEEQSAWLGRKAGQAGFAVVSATASKQAQAVSDIYRRGPAPSGHKVTLFAVRFDGILRVTDPDLLIAAVEHGIGSGKGLGFGLLSLAPAAALQPGEA